LKTDSKSDDRYDAFRYGLYGGLSVRRTPQEEADKAFAASIVDPVAKHFYLRKQAALAKDRKSEFRQPEVPFWQTKL
jgi:hypothetical protein